MKSDGSYTVHCKMLFCAETTVRVTQFELAHNYEEREVILVVWGLSGLQFFWLQPLGDLMVMKILEDEWYVVNDKFTVF